MPDDGLVAEAGPMEFQIVLVGEPTTDEFEIVAEVLVSAAPDATYRVAADLDQLAVDLRDEDVPDLIVFVQTWSDEYRFANVVTLPGIGPLTPMVCVYGPWCTADGRSRQDWPLALWIPIEHFREELLQHYFPANASVPEPRPGRSSYLIPWTAGRDEIFAARYALPSQFEKMKRTRHALQRRVRIDTPDLSMRKLWREVLERAGFQVYTTASNVSCDVILWDADPGGNTQANSELLEVWSLLRAGTSRSRFFVITGFETPDLVTRWESLGADGVISKLLPLAALLELLVRSLSTGD